MTCCPPSRRGNRPSAKTPPPTQTPTSVTTDQPRACTRRPYASVLVSNSISSPKTTTITPITVRIVAINPTFGHGSSRSRKSEATVSTAVITSTAKKSRISGTELTAVVPSNLVTPSVPATSRQFSVTTRRLVTA